MNNFIYLLFPLLVVFNMMAIPVILVIWILKGIAEFFTELYYWAQYPIGGIYE